jgi:stage V sporulation protein B
VSAAARSFIRTLPLDRTLLRSSAVVLAGSGVARLLGFLFYVAAARLLGPAEYGVLAYALAILTAASILLTNSQGGLARFLARHHQDRRKQEIYYSNWVAVMGVMLTVSIVAFIPFAPLAGLNGWLLVGAIVNLANIAVFEMYVETQRGLSRFTMIGAYYSLANLLQLLAILAAGLLGLRSAALFLVFYGLSAIAALGLMRLASPTPLTVRLAAVAWRHVVRIVRYVSPIIAQGVFYAFWWSVDLILIQHLLQPAATGNYAAAKTLTQVLILPPIAIAMTASPRIARLPEPALRPYVARLLGLAAAVIVPLAVGLALLQRPLAQLFFGSKYTHVFDAFDPLVVGVALYGFYLVTASVWQALGRPAIGAIATAAGTLCTVGLALVLIPRLGLQGGGISFAAGAAMQFAVVAGCTVWGLYSSATVRVKHLPDKAMLGLDDVEADAANGR